MMLLESGLKTADSFPAGLKVLVVDDDPTWLKILEKMLKKCSYEVTTCGLAIEALRLLRERKDGFDIVISDVNMPDMDGFKLLEHVGLQMDLPVIMMSVDGETSRVMRGVQHGACDYLLKPIRMKELKNIWQHVLRKRMHDVRDIESHDNLDDDDLHLFRYYDQSDGGHFLTSSDHTFLRKRKDMDSKKGVKDSIDPSAKRRRVVWSVDLHQKFVKAVNQIGFDRVGPKKILDLMNVPLLTRENVASHLQKYRLYLSRLEKENGFKSKSPKESVGGFGPQYSTAVQQSELINFPCPDYKPLEQNIDAKPCKISPNSINSRPFVENVFTSDVAQLQEAAFSPNVGHEISTGLREPKFGVAASDSPLPSQFIVSRESQHSPSELEYKPHQQLLEMSSVKELKFSSTEICNNITEEPHLIGQLTESFGLTTNSSIHIDQNGLPGFQFEPRNQTLNSVSAFGSLTDELGGLSSFQDDNFATASMGFDNIEYSFPDVSNEALSFCLYGQPRFNYEYFSDSVENPAVDQSLFIS